MGYSGGQDFKDLDGNEFHIEAKERGVAVWSKDEMKRFFMMTPEQARMFADDLILHASFVDGGEEDHS